MKQAVLVGCGVMGARWASALSASPLRERVRLVALVDVDRDVAEAVKVANRLNEAVVGSDLDAVLSDVKAELVFDVAVPAVRREVVLTAFKHGCDVLTEKPLAASMSDAGAILAASQKYGRLHAVTQNRRFKQSIRRIRDFIASGALGELSALHCDFFVGAHFGGFRDVMEHVLLLDMAIHTFDAARFMSGKDPRAVYCYETNPRGSWYAHGAAANAIFELAGDVVFTYRGSWAAEGANTSWESSWRLIGTRGTLLWDGADRFEAHVVAGNEGFHRPLSDLDIPPAADASKIHGHASVLAAFLDAIEGGTAPETVGTDNIKSLAMVFGAIESARTGQRQTILPETR